MTKKKRLSATVAKIIPPLITGEPERVEISIAGAEELYREVRIDNIVTDENGRAGALKLGAQVDVVIEASVNAVTGKDDQVPHVPKAAKRAA